LRPAVAQASAQWPAARSWPRWCTTPARSAQGSGFPSSPNRRFGGSAPFVWDRYLTRQQL